MKPNIKKRVLIDRYGVANRRVKVVAHGRAVHVQINGQRIGSIRAIVDAEDTRHASALAQLGLPKAALVGADVLGLSLDEAVVVLEAARGD